jgi:hypothetical protein
VRAGGSLVQNRILSYSLRITVGVYIIAKACLAEWIDEGIHKSHHVCCWDQSQAFSVAGLCLVYGRRERLLPHKRFACLATLSPPFHASILGIFNAALI